jgi:UDP-N-acetylglucosamine 2-epimerase
MKLEEVLLDEKPDWVLVYGDTNTTLAGALAAVKLRIPLAHVEAGLRSFNREMPEEHNRVLTDRCADVCFCPTKKAVEWLVKEGVVEGVHLVGDVMYDAVLMFEELARRRSAILRDLKLTPGDYLLATAHRVANTDNLDNLTGILEVLLQLDEQVVFPVHPRTRKQLTVLEGGGSNLDDSKLRLIEPVGYLEMLMLEKNARVILTDSGGVQKEAYFLGVPCVTLRDETEWVETVEAGWNKVTGVSKEKVVEALRKCDGVSKLPRPELYGNGMAAKKIVEVLSKAGTELR